MFIADSPATGWRWMRRIASITFTPDGDGDNNVDGNSNIYLLPVWFQGEINGPIVFDTNTNNGASIKWVDEATIRHLQSNTTYTGEVRWAAVKPSGQDRRWELLVYPFPDDGDTLTFPWTVTFDKMVETTDVSPAGMKFDDSVLAACLARAEMELTDVVGGYVDLYNKKDLPKAHKLDGASAPRRIGNLNTNKRSYGYKEGLNQGDSRIWNDVTFT